MRFIQPPTHDERAGFRQRFCGPAALSALTGLPAETVARQIEHLTNTPAAKLAGMRVWEMQSALAHFGFSVARELRYGELQERPKRRRGRWAAVVRPGDLEGEVELAWVGRPTLARWMRERDVRTFNALCVVVLSPAHFVVVQGEDVADNQQGLVPAKRSRHRRRSVRRVLVLGTRFNRHLC